MSGDIYFGFDKTKPVGTWHNDGYVNTPTFMAFGEFLDAALAEKHPVLLEVIKEGESMAMYCFYDLSASDYNAVIHTIRTYVATLKNPSDWQSKGIWVWTEMAEPFIHKDERYDDVAARP